jgi:voltage-gated potassium channel
MLRIVSRAADERSVAKLSRAGAISPYAIGGCRLAYLIRSPPIGDFLETALRCGSETLASEDLAIADDGRSPDRALGDLEDRAGPRGGTVPEAR